MVYLQEQGGRWFVSGDKAVWEPLPKCRDAVDALNNAHTFFPAHLVAVIGVAKDIPKAA